MIVLKNKYKWPIDILFISSFLVGSHIICTVLRESPFPLYHIYTRTALLATFFTLTLQMTLNRSLQKGYLLFYCNDYFALILSCLLSVLFLKKYYYCLILYSLRLFVEW